MSVRAICRLSLYFMMTDIGSKKTDLSLNGFTHKQFSVF